MMINVVLYHVILFACFECFRRPAPLIRRALRTSPLHESTWSPNAAAQICSSLLLSSTACEARGGASVLVAAVCVQSRIVRGCQGCYWIVRRCEGCYWDAPTDYMCEAVVRGSGP
jgi:hypothetical protein